MRRPATPAPPPETKIAKRLEYVRTRNDFVSLRAFWAHLAEGWTEGRVSYEAARNYHYDRNPPVAYLVRVSEVFRVSLRWLATGDGPYDWPTPPLRGGRDEIFQRALLNPSMPVEHHELVYEMKEALQAAITETLNLSGHDLFKSDDKQVADAAAAVASFWTMPLNVLGTHEEVRQDLKRWRAYWNAMAQAWDLAVPARGELGSLPQIVDDLNAICRVPFPSDRDQPPTFDSDNKEAK